MYDFIIVGSGPSGGTLARSLIEAGAKCLLLEAGKFYRKDTFPRNEADFSAQLFWGGGIEFNEKATMAFLRARCVGGTSIVNQALLDRFDQLAWDDWKQRSGVDFFSLEATAGNYDRVEERVQLHTFNETECNRNAQLFSNACTKLGHKWHFLRRGQSDCKLDEGNDCIGCLGGCHRDSKQSTLVTAVQVAEKIGLEVEAEFLVNHIETMADQVSVFGIQHGKKRKLRAKKLILAGGSFGTTQIMLKSGFKGKLPALGTGFSSHPQYMSFGIFEEPVNSHKGAFQTVASKDPKFRENGFKLENVYAGPISIGMLFNALGTKHQELMRKYRYMSCIEVAVRDEPVGEIKIDKKGKLVVAKELTEQDYNRKEKGLQVVDEIMSSCGAKKVVKSPYHFGLHLMGGCQIGVDETKSVVDPEFKVHGHPNIFIADSSIYPSAPGINPSLTVMMLAQRLGEQLIGNGITKSEKPASEVKEPDEQKSKLKN